MATEFLTRRKIRPGQNYNIHTSDYAIFVTYAKRQSDKFTYGADLKVIRKNIADAGAWGLGT